MIDTPFGGVRAPSNPEYRPLAAMFVGDVTIDADQPYYVNPLPRLQYQSHAGACVAHGFSYAAEAEALSRAIVVQVCRQDLYFGARWLRGWERQDSGCLLPDMATWMGQYGCLSEDRKPWNASDVTTWRPDPKWVNERRSLTCKYDPMSATLTGVLTELAANRAIPFAHWVTNGMLNPVNGIERWKASEPRLGAHCRAIVGYDPDTGFLVVNSWRGWGKSHPVLNRTHPDSFTWVPVETMLDPSFSFDFHRLTRPLPVEGVDA